MSESERVVSMQVRSDVLLVNLRLQLIGIKNHDDVGFFGSLVLEHDLQASFFSLLPSSWSLRADQRERRRPSP